MKYCVTLLLIVIHFSSFAQDQPKLVVGIVVDQMTNDYLYRFSGHFSENGIKMLMTEGYYFPNTFYNYMSTSTGPGHASIYTGSTPSTHGIPENNFYDYSKKNGVYCVRDEAVKGVGTNEDIGRRSPANLETSTITDMFSLSMSTKSKVIGIALKDRSAILPAGHMADAAYWWDDKNASWVSSTYYFDNTPKWINDFENKNPLNNYLKVWESSFEPTEEEKQSYAFHNQFESPLSENAGTSMPYDLSKIAKEKGPSVLKTSPFGNTYTFDFAKTVLTKEAMGKDDVCDFLCLSLSSTDYVGHNFGPYSEEIKDTYLKLDNDLAEFLSFLDENVGKDNYLLFLTSDHGVVPNVNFLQSKKFPAQKFNLDSLQSNIEALLLETFKTKGLIIKVTNNQVYMNIDKINEAGLQIDKILRAVSDYLNSQDNVLLALTSHDLTYKSYTEFPAKEMKAAYYKNRSGQVLFVFKNYMRSAEHEKGTGHGTVFNYDRNVPLIFYGKNIKSGISYQNVEITQIASTLADLLKIQRPPSCVSESLIEKLINN